MVKSSMSFSLYFFCVFVLILFISCLITCEYDARTKAKREYLQSQKNLSNRLATIDDYEHRSNPYNRESYFQCGKKLFKESCYSSATSADGSSTNYKAYAANTKYNHD